MTVEEIHGKLKEKFEDDVLELLQPDVEPEIEVEASEVAEISAFLKNEADLDFNVLMCLSGMDFPTPKKKPPKKLKEGEEPPPEEPEVPHRLATVYHLYSMKHRHRVVLKAFVLLDSPTFPSVTDLWSAADWHEREAYDMYGIVYEGHPNLQRLLLPDDWEGFPLRKDYQVQDYYDVNGEDILVPKKLPEKPDDTTSDNK